MSTMANNTAFNSTCVDDETANYFLSWMRSAPGLSYQYSNQILANLPSPRYQTYEQSDFDNVKNDVLAYLYPITQHLGMFHVATDLSLLFSLLSYSNAVMFIGLIFNVLLFIFIVVSCLLIYSLLLISVETKTFEIGVMRLVGLTKFGFVGLILTQATMFVLPSVIIGFVLSVPCIWFIYSMLFTDEMGLNPSILPGWYSSIQAILIGILIPIISSIVPIKRAISQNLTDALNTQRNKNTGILVTFTNN